MLDIYTCMHTLLINHLTVLHNSPSRSAPTLPPKRPQQIRPPRIIQLTQIPLRIGLVRRELLSGKRLPQRPQNIIDIIPIGKRQDPLILHIRRQQRRNMHPRRILHIHHPLRRERLQGTQIAPVGLPHPIPRAEVHLIIQRPSEIRIRQHRVQRERRLLLLHKLPHRLLRLRLARGVHGQRALRSVGARFPRSFHILVVPVVRRDGELHIWFGDRDRHRRRRVHEPHDALLMPFSFAADAAAFRAPAIVSGTTAWGSDEKDTTIATWQTPFTPLTASSKAAGEEAMSSTTTDSNRPLPYLVSKRSCSHWALEASRAVPRTW